MGKERESRREIYGVNKKRCIERAKWIGRERQIGREGGESDGGREREREGGGERERERAIGAGY